MIFLLSKDFVSDFSETEAGWPLVQRGKSSEFLLKYHTKSETIRSFTVCLIITAGITTTR